MNKVQRQAAAERKEAIESMYFMEFGETIQAARAKRGIHSDPPLEHFIPDNLRTPDAMCSCKHHANSGNLKHFAPGPR